ncbi:MAG: hypothetical protein IT551_08835 [Novosphingobium sp.]|nr:hypothetical protein [Novosphingobium sp.]
MPYANPLTTAQRKIARLDHQIATLQGLRYDALRERGQELGFKPCIDCHDGFCTMNCSSAPIIMKVQG